MLHGMRKENWREGIADVRKQYIWQLSRIVCVVRASLQQSIHIWHAGIFLYKMLCFWRRRGNAGMEGRTKCSSLWSLFSGEDGERSQWTKSIMREQTYRSRLLLASRWCTAICIISCRFLLARMVFERHKRRKRKMSPLTLSAILARNLERSLGMKLSLALAIKFGTIKCDV